MESNNKKIEVPTNNKVQSLLQKVKPRQMIYPIIIGLGVASWMLYAQLKGANIPFEVLEITKGTIFWLFIALLMMVSRDFGYMLRLRVLSGKQLSWRQVFRVIILWEFTSAVTPSVVGGTSLAVIYLYKEKLTIGQSSAIVMATSFLDELYFAIMFPLLFVLVSPQDLFSVGNITGNAIDFGNEFFYFAVVGYGFKLAYILILAYGLFKNPLLIKKLIVWIFKLPLLRRKKASAEKAGDEIISSSEELRGKPFLFWIKAFLATFFSWTARYWVVNAIFLAFFVFEKSHFLLFARQLVMWIMMLVSPTPGGSGFSEFVFSEYLGDFLPPVAGVAVIMAVLWRLFTYYPYLFAGAIIVPKWIKSKFGG